MVRTATLVISHGVYTNTFTSHGAYINGTYNTLLCHMVRTTALITSNGAYNNVTYVSWCVQQRHIRHMVRTATSLTSHGAYKMSLTSRAAYNNVTYVTWCVQQRHLRHMAHTTTSLTSHGAYSKFNYVKWCIQQHFIMSHGAVLGNDTFQQLYPSVQNTILLNSVQRSAFFLLPGCNCLEPNPCFCPS